MTFALAFALALLAAGPVCRHDGGGPHPACRADISRAAPAGDAHAERAHAGRAHAGRAHAGRAHAGRAHAGRAHAGDGQSPAEDGRLLAARQAADDPAGTAPPPPVVELAPTPPHPLPRADKAQEPHGADAAATRFVQMAAGTGACCVGCCLSAAVGYPIGLIPVVGVYASELARDAITGAVIGGSEGAIGDIMGQERAPMIWPVLASVGILAVGSAGSIVVDVVQDAKGIVRPDPLTAPQAAVNAYLAQNAGYVATSAAFGIGSIVAAIVVPALVYGAAAVPKKAGDEGQGYPGFLEPADPTALPDAPLVAMRY